MLFAPVAGMGHLYLAPPSSSGRCSPGTPPPACCRDRHAARSAMRVFGWSISYITLLFGAMAVDQLVRSGW